MILKVVLLSYQQLARGRKITSGERVEIHTRRDGFTDFIPTVPVRRTALTFIVSRRLVSECQHPHQSAIDSIDVH